MSVRRLQLRGAGRGSRHVLILFRALMLSLKTLLVAMFRSLLEEWRRPECGCAWLPPPPSLPTQKGSKEPPLHLHCAGQKEQHKAKTLPRLFKVILPPVLLPLHIPQQHSFCHSSFLPGQAALLQAWASADSGFGILMGVSSAQLSAL